MMILDKSCNLYLLLLFLFISNSCTNSNHKTVINGQTMGTTYSITLRQQLNDKNLIKSQIDSILINTNNIFSTYDTNSELSKINKSKLKTIPLSDDFSYVLNKALNYCTISKGSYDITIGPLVKLWNFENFKHKEIPTKENIIKTLDLVGYEKISINNKMLYKKNNVIIDLNSIAKGYAVDIIYNYLKKMSLENFLIEIGGEIRTNGDNWIIGIQHPLSSSIISKIQLNNMSMATSGTYNNNFIYNDNIYAHIINPKSGYPYEYSDISATIISNNCLDADALATMALTMNKEDFLDIINNDANVECYIVEVIENKIVEYKSLNFNKYITD